MKTVLTITFFFFATHLISQPLSPDVVSIEMRDGKFLAADVYIPDEEHSRPTILIQTPYNKFYSRYSLPLNIGINLSSSPYNFVIVDWRGFYASGSAAVAQPNRGQDGYDVIDWIIEQEWSNGKVGTWGPSALAKIQYETAREQHPSHICAVPLVASPEFLYQTYYPNGVYRKEYLDQLDALGYGLSATVLANPYYNVTWQYIENNNFYPQSIKVPMLLVGGWYDHAIVEMVKYFDNLRNLSHSSVRTQHRFLIGPWAHGGFGAAQVGTGQQGELFFPEAADWSTTKALEFFAYYLLDADNGWLSNNPVYQYFQMGDMLWLGSDVWPPQDLTSTKLYFHENNQLSASVPEDDFSNSTFSYDPRDPSPTIGGATLRQDLLQGPYDQSVLVESRDDIILFTSETLSQAFVHKGKAKVKLFVSSDQLDTDFVVRLCNVYPDNRSVLLTENTFRMRFKNGFWQANESFMNSGDIYQIEIILPDISHTFLPGHKIRVGISSSNYPRFDNNLNNGSTMYVSGDTLVATNKIHHQQSGASYIEFFCDNATNIVNKEPHNLSVYPNPAKNSDIIYISNSENIDQIRIIDNNGRLVKKIMPEKINEGISLSSEKPGVYILEIMSSAKLFNYTLVLTE